MANPWHQDPGPPADPATKLDLSRLMHPLLEQNLDKLAEVYLTNPPEERDKAIAELLRDLQARAAASGTAMPAPSAGSAPAAASPVCPSCHRQSSAQQRFCGFCGTPLYVDAPHSPDPPPEPVFAEEGGGFLGLSSLPNESLDSSPLDNDVQFLRDRTFGGVYATDEPSSSHWKYWVAAIVLLLLAGLGYREWTALGRPQSIAQVMSARRAAPAQPPTPAPNAAQPQAAQPASQPAQNAPATAQNAAAANQPNGVTETDIPGPTEPGANEPAAPAAQEAAPAAQDAAPAENAANPSNAQNVQPTTPPARKAPVEKPVALASRTETNSASPAAALGGTQELALAQRYLNQHETTLAAEWLWKSVSKQNGQAALLLAGLYQRGDGVPRSCEQARILLVVAAKKGVEGAGPQLRNIEGTCR